MFVGVAEETKKIFVRTAWKKSDNAVWSDCEIVEKHGLLVEAAHLAHNMT